MNKQLQQKTNKMNSQEFETIIQNGQLHSYLSERLSQDVLVAYEEAFGGVNNLATARDMLSIIVQRVEGADAATREKFFQKLNSPKEFIAPPKPEQKESKLKTIWLKIKKLF